MVRLFSCLDRGGRTVNLPSLVGRAMAAVAKAMSRAVYLIMVGVLETAVCRVYLGVVFFRLVSLEV